MMSMSMMSTFRRIVGEADPTLRAEPPPREPRHGVEKVLIMLMLIIISSMSPSVDLSKNR